MEEEEEGDEEEEFREEKVNENKICEKKKENLVEKKAALDKKKVET